MLPVAVDDLKVALRQLIVSGTPTEKIVVAEAHPDYPEEVAFQLFEGEQVFYTRYKDWVSCYCVLSEVFNLPAFLEVLQEDGWTVVFGPTTKPILENYERWATPLEVEGYTLHDFQQFSLNRAFEKDYWFFNWATGAGKSFVCAAGAKKLFALGKIDVVIVCTLSKSKINQLRFFAKAGLDVVINDGTKPKRTKVYAERHQVYVMNYEKLNFDEPQISKLISGQRTLFIFDETHKLVTSDKQNKARQAFELMVGLAEPGTMVWPMSASVVNGNPLRFRDVFSLGKGRHNPLGSQSGFERRYADKINRYELKTKKGQRFEVINYDWNLGRLQEVRHRVGGYTQTARKTDPGLREHFKGLDTFPEYIQSSLEEEAIFETIIDRAWTAYHREESLGPYYDLLRYTCNTPLALLVTDNEVGKEIAAEFSETLKKVASSKLERLNEHLESIRESQDKVLVFTHWTNLSLHLIKDQIEVPHVVHYGVGQSNKDSQKAQDDFWENPDITCFLTSDAGSHGLNMQCARYVIQYEPTYSYDDGMQRASRIDRSDSHLDGLTNYVYLVEGSVEERVWQINNDRRIISSVVQGTQETLSYGDQQRAQLSEQQNMRWLMFGDRM